MYATSSLSGIMLAVLTMIPHSVSAQAQTPNLDATPDGIRIATFNVSLYGKVSGEIRKRLSDRDDAQAKKIAAIVQSIRPDILLVNELDYEAESGPARLLAENYFAVGQESGSGTLEPIVFDHLYSARSNTGIDSTIDLNNDGKLGSGNDAWGYGVYPGQYAMTVFSRFPIDRNAIRTFQKLKWKEMPNALRPKFPTGDPYYNDSVWSKLRLSSKNHIDVPIRVGDRVIHILGSHPTPPVFDGQEDRNGCRNHDEVEFWNRYLSGDPETSSWIIDDAGTAGALNASADFVVLGDLNADPNDGSGRREAIRSLLAHRRVADITPSCDKADLSERARKHKGSGDLRHKTADFGRNGFMRVDYVLPSRTLHPTDAGIFWPNSSDPRHPWISASDHRMVWVDLDLSGKNP
ncbi:MAG: endonuclease/exonuclease/phosphatase family protein [Planctomycetota bacterium]